MRGLTVCFISMYFSQAKSRYHLLFYGWISNSTDKNMFTVWILLITLHCRHHERDGVSCSQPPDWPPDCLPNRFRHRSKKISKLRVTCPCVGNSPVTGEFTVGRASNEENVFIWWRLHEALTNVYEKIKHTEACIKYPMCCSWYLQMHFRQWRNFNFDWIAPNVLSKGPINHKSIISIVSTSSLKPNSRQAIKETYIDQIWRCHMSLLSRLNSVYHRNLEKKFHFPVNWACRPDGNCGTTLLAPYQITATHSRSGTRRFYLRVPDMQMSCKGLTSGQGTTIWAAIT